MRTATRQTIGVLLLGLAWWACFTWPLPRFFLTGIPCSDRNTEIGHARETVPGDHLQLLYHFWLARDMLGGGTPPFGNVYEFNTGDDRARRQVDAYYAPFSLVFAAVSPWAGEPAGWNAAALLSWLAGFWACWRLARRYAGGDGTAALLATLVAASFPYRWITLLVGSPAGFAMGLVPLLFLGLDAAVRDGRARGGLLAGATLLAACTSDLQIFYFMVLAAPVGCFLAWLAAPAAILPDRTRLRAAVRGLWPALPGGIAAVALSSFLGRQFDVASLEDGRSWRDVTGFSPHPAGLFSPFNRGMSNHVFLGVGLVLLLAAATVAFVAGTKRKRNLDVPADVPAVTRPTLLAVLLLAALAVAVCLALGTNGPAHGALLRACRSFLPKYDLIRQTVKIYCLFPTLLAVLLALLLPALRRWRRGPLAAGLLGLAAVADARLHVDASICLLPPEQPAYAAAVRRAADGNEPPARAVVLPLWPGDSHWTSIYQYYVTLSRLRLVNGYASTRNPDYANTVFHRFESLNQGIADDAQLDALLRMGVRYVLLHEDAFPEQVSPFPAGVTLRRLLSHPRLDRIGRAGTVWSFRIRQAVGPGAGDPVAEPSLFGAARRWECEKLARAGFAVAAAMDASGGSVIEGTAGAHALLFLRSPLAPAPDLRLMLRARGQGAVGILDAAAHPGNAVLEVDAPEWTWLEQPVVPASQWVPAPPSHDLAVVPHAWAVTVTAGRVSLDAALIAAGHPLRPDASGRIALAAADLFHAGASNPDDGSVNLEPQRDPQGAIVYGPHLPVPPGRYAVTLESDSTAPEGTELGSLAVGPAGGEMAITAARAGGPCVLRAVDLDNRPLRLEFRYLRTAPLRIRRFVLAAAE
jgi:hypothetical protein